MINSNSNESKQDSEITESVYPRFREEDGPNLLRLLLLLFCLIAYKPYERRDNMPTIHIAGDSTAAEKDENKRPETGWGEKISAYFSS